MKPLSRYNHRPMSDEVKRLLLERLNKNSNVVFVDFKRTVL